MLALVISLRATRLAQGAQQQPAEMRELIREMEDVLEKLAQRQARESMRVLRQVRSKATKETEPEEEPSPAAPPTEAGRDLKADLWQIARARGITR